MNSSPARIRGYRPDDLDDLYRVCLQTADNGQDASSLFSDPLLPGHIFMAPYVTFDPALAFVAEDEEGPGGYIVGTLDSLAFQERLERDWWPALRARYPEPSPEADDGYSPRDSLALNRIYHPSRTPPELAGPFPSHLHINLMPRLQGNGMGRELIETLASALRDQGSPGVHLGVGRANKRAVGFYRHVGFEQQEETPVSFVLTMDLRRSSTPAAPDTPAAPTSP